MKRRGIRPPRYGAVGRHGSIAVVERFIRSMKSECTRRIPVPLGLKEMWTELVLYANWYDTYRPHGTLAGKTPEEVYRGLPPKNAQSRFEPRPGWPPGSRCAAPQTSIKGKRGAPLVLAVRCLEGRKHLPIIELKTAA